MIKNKKIAIIGCGNLGLSILNGLLAKNEFPPSNITVTKRNTRSLDHLKNTGIHITNDNVEAVQNAEIIIFALKPYNILDCISELSVYFDSKKHSIVSLATGISLLDIETKFENKLPIYRAMPNTAAGVSEAITCLCSNQKTSNEIILNIFNSIGQTIEIDEILMESATVLGACGIAYVLRFIRAMIQGGIQIGFDAKTASTIVNQTVIGAAALLSANKEHPEFEIDKVTTPKGCTIVGLNEMEHNGFSSALIKGIVSSYERIEK